MGRSGLKLSGWALVLTAGVSSFLWPVCFTRGVIRACSNSSVLAAATVVVVLVWAAAYWGCRVPELTWFVRLMTSQKRCCFTTQLSLRTPGFAFLSLAEGKLRRKTQIWWEQFVTWGGSAAGLSPSNTEHCLFLPGKICIVTTRLLIEKGEIRHVHQQGSSYLNNATFERWQQWGSV